MEEFLRNNRALILAYDQGIEHGPSDFLKNKGWDPEYILELAEKGPFTGVILHKGIVEKYVDNNFEVPIVLKLSGRSKFNPKLKQSLVCSVKYAEKLGVEGVGFTIYPFSEYEDYMLEKLREVHEEARESNKTLFVWAYPRGKGVDEFKTENIAYATRLAAELGADFIKVKYNHKKKEYDWVIKNALRSKILIAGGKKVEKEEDLLNMTKEIISLGAHGLAIGRNIWQREESEALELAKKLAKIIFND
ncbi:MAG TPA: aldolase [Nautiliaceae bacterium]|nr:aldolase [Nautiliaceae bacterium]